MVPNLRRFVLCASAGLLCAATNIANATSVSYFLDQSNTTPPFPDGSNYLTVTIDDNGGIGASGDNVITFTVATVAGAVTPGTGSYGIQSFGFADIGGFISGDSPSTEWILPTGWEGNVPPPANGQDGFGRFDLVVSNGGANRQDPLIFSLDVFGDTIANYVDLSANPGNNPNPPAEGNVFFAAHLAGFADTNGVTSAWFGGSTVVPVPAAVWLFGSGLLGLVGIARRRRS